MTSRQFANYNGGPVGHPDDDIPDNDIPVNDVPVNDVPVMPMKKRPPVEKSDGWHKTALSKAGMEGDVMTFRDDRGYIQVELKKIDAATVRNLLSVARGSKAKWRVRWFSDSNGVRHATEVLTDEQYREYSKAAWQNRKLWREGFATANPFTA